MNTHQSEEPDELPTCIAQKVERAKLETAYTESLRKTPNLISNDEE